MSICIVPARKPTWRWMPRDGYAAVISDTKRRWRHCSLCRNRSAFCAPASRPACLFGKHPGTATPKRLVRCKQLNRSCLPDFDRVPETVEMTLCGKPYSLPTELGNRSCDSPIPTAPTTATLTLKRTRKEQFLSGPPSALLQAHSSIRKDCTRE